MKTKRNSLRLIVMLVLALIIITTHANEPAKPTSLSELSNATFYQTSSSDVNLKLLNIQFDPLGFLFFGPQLGVDFQFADIVAIGPYFRWNYAGLIYQGIVTDWFSNETTTSIDSYGIGFGAKIIPPIGSGKHRPYVDIGFEKFKGKDSYDPGDSYGKHYFEYKANVFHIGAGYRLVTESSFNLSVGLTMFIQKETEDIDYYEFESTISYNSLEEPHLGAMLQLMLGWQLGN
ncbi:MAG: hypothetical protein ACLFVR_05100 [Thiohalospira sp.]